MTHSNCLRLASALFLTLVLSGCTQSLEIRLDHDQRGVSFSFWSDGWFPKRKIPCVWLFQIIDQGSGAIPIERRTANQCVTLGELNLSVTVRGLAGKGDSKSLVPGKLYRAEAVIEGGVARSKPWIAP